MSDAPTCAGCKQPITNLWDRVVHLKDNWRPTDDSGGVSDEEAALYHEDHAPGFETPIYQGTFAAWPGRDPEY
jgi:hypothetical protein